MSSKSKNQLSFDTNSALDKIQQLYKTRLIENELTTASTNLLGGLKSEATVLGQEGLISDFERQNAMLGDIYQKTSNGWWVYVGNITQFDPSIKLNDSLVKQGYFVDVATYTTTSGSTFELGISGLIPKLTDSQVQVSFSQSKAFFGVLKNQVSYSLALDLIKDKLDSIWIKNGYKSHPRKFFLVSEIYVADSGVMLYSQKSGTNVILTSKNNIKINELNMLASDELTITYGSQSILNIISTKRIVPLFQAYRRRLIDGLWEPME